LFQRKSLLWCPLMIPDHPLEECLQRGGAAASEGIARVAEARSSAESSSAPSFSVPLRSRPTNPLTAPTSFR
jgi:hypothetical protein